MVKEFLLRVLVSTAILLITGGSIAYGIYLIKFVAVGLPEFAIVTAFTILSILTLAFNLIGTYYYLRSCGLDKFAPKQPKSYPRIAIIIPTRNEDSEMVARNLKSLTRLDYPKEKLSFYVLDNSNQPDKTVEEASKRLGFSYEYIQNPVKLKSYVLNKRIEELDEEFIAIFDADEYLTEPAFLKDCLSELQANPSAGFVQTTKEFAPGSFFANATNLFYLYFYKYMQPVRSLARSAIFCGSCGIIRRSVWQKVGGFPHTPTEDLAFAFLADRAGNGGVHIPKCYALGEAVETFTTFLSQQWRYTIGTIRLIPYYLASAPNLSIWKNLHYLSQVTSYMYPSIVVLLYTTTTMLLAMYGITQRPVYLFLPVQMSPQVLGYISILAFIVMTLATAKMFFGSITHGLVVFLLNFSAVFLRARAILVGLLGMKTQFVMTRQAQKHLSLPDALKLTKFETVFSLLLLALAATAYQKSDVLSAFWLAFNSWLFFSSFLFTYFTNVRAAPSSQ